jgi:hypothetical protein
MWSFEIWFLEYQKKIAMKTINLISCNHEAKTSYQACHHFEKKQKNNASKSSQVILQL